MSNRIRLSAIALLAGTAAILALPASASMVDLTTLGAHGSFGAADFVQVSNQSTGTGVIDPFVRIQKNNGERGVNSDGPYTMNEKNGSWTHSIRVSDFGTVMHDGTQSIRFLLDINQSSNNPLLSMDGFQVFVASNKDYNTLSDLNSNATLLYDMGVGNWVKMDYSLENGSGSGDMMAYLPYDLFSPHQDKYLYLYSDFGTSGPLTSNAGFEEWARVDGQLTTPVPEPASLLLLGGGLVAGAVARRRRRSA
jgi:hypothetical protein